MPKQDSKASWGPCARVALWEGVGWERLITAGVFLLPLLCWPGLERPFSTPKIWLLACLDAGLAAHYLLGQKSKPHSAPYRSEWIWLIWPAALALSALSAPYASLQALVLAVLPVPLCWAVRQGQLRAERLKRAILLASALQSTIALLQYAGHDPLRWLGWHPEIFASPRMRVYGTLGNPDFVAAWLCATLPLYAGVLEGGQKRTAFQASVWWVALALQLGAILATGSRAFLLTLPVGAAALTACSVRSRKWWLAGLPVAAALLWLSPARPLGVTVQGRLYLAQVVTTHSLQIPLTGYGPGSFRLQFAQWQVEWLRQDGAHESASRFAGPLDHAHNDYLELWVEYGPAGLCAFLVLCGWLVGKAWRTRWKGVPLGDAGVWGGVASLLVIACVDFPFHRPAEWGLYWLLLGMLGSGLSGQPRSDCGTEVS